MASEKFGDTYQVHVPEFLSGNIEADQRVRFFYVQREHNITLEIRKGVKKGVAHLAPLWGLGVAYARRKFEDAPDSSPAPFGAHLAPKAGQGVLPGK